MIAPQANPLFDVVIYPNQPVGPRTFALLMAVASLIIALMSAAFIAAGAWPVSGFLGLDLILLYLAFRWAQKEARSHQRVTLDDQTLRIESIDGNGKARFWRFEPYWTKVEIDRPPARKSLVILSSKGRRLHIGQFLTPQDRLKFADALISALENHRQHTK